MIVIRKFGIFLVCCCLFACSEKSVAPVAVSVPKQVISKDEQEKSKSLAYVHGLTIELDKSLVTQTHSKIITSCNNDTKYKCVVLSASYNSGDFQSSKISLRTIPSGVAFFSDLASKEGTVSSNSSVAEDLGDKIVDSQKRIEMLEAYLAKLEVLESQPNNNIDALVKIASELSKTQNEIEYAKGKRATLLQRVDMDVLNISLITQSNTSFFGPISNALDDFGVDFSNGISEVIIASAYLIPWIVFLGILFFIFRIGYKLLRKTK